jgi:hypothetical protein
MARKAIFGRSGAGKSWYGGHYLEEIVPKFDYAVHFDIEDEERGLSRPQDSIFKTFYVDKEFANREVDYQGRVMPLVSAVVLENKKVRVVPDGLTPTEQRGLFAELAGLSMEIGKTEANFHLSADEAHQVVPDVADDLDERVIRMLTGGRKKGVEFCLITQRPANMHSEAYSQLNYAAYFSLTKDVDIGKVNGSCGFNAYNVLPELDVREFVLEDLDSGELRLHSTEDDTFERDRPHAAADDGVADEIIDDQAADGVNLRESDDIEI